METKTETNNQLNEKMENLFERLRKVHCYASEIKERSRYVMNYYWAYYKDNKVYHLVHQEGFVSKNKNYLKNYCYYMNTWYIKELETSKVINIEDVGVYLEEHLDYIEKANKSFLITETLVNEIRDILGECTYNFSDEMGWIIYGVYRIGVRKYEHNDMNDCNIYIKDEKGKKEINTIEKLKKQLPKIKKVMDIHKSMKLELEELSKKLELEYKLLLDKKGLCWKVGEEKWNIEYNKKGVMLITNKKTKLDKGEFTEYIENTFKKNTFKEKTIEDVNNNDKKYMTRNNMSDILRKIRESNMFIKKSKKQRIEIQSCKKYNEYE